MAHTSFWQQAALVVLTALVLVQADNSVIHVMRKINEGTSNRIFNMRNETSAGTSTETLRYLMRKSGTFDPSSIFSIESDWLIAGSGQNLPDRESLCAQSLCDCQSSSLCKVSFFVDVAKAGEDYVWRVLNVTVNVEDVNYQTPTFLQPSYTLTLAEGDASAQVELPTATDSDWSGRVCKYDIRNAEDSADLFTVKKVNDKHFLALRRALDRESKSEYNVELAAFECVTSGITAKVGTADLKVSCLLD